MNYFICGFSGAGKSTLIEEYKNCETSKLTPIDLDTYIFTHHAHGYKTLGDFIQAVGIDHFRATEFASLMQLNMQDNLLVALGGGALNEQTIGILASWSGVWLNTEFDTCWKRIKSDPNRPLVKLGENGLKELYNERISFYSQYPKIYDITQLLEKTSID